MCMFLCTTYKNKVNMSGKSQNESFQLKKTIIAGDEMYSLKKGKADRAFVVAFYLVE